MSTTTKKIQGKIVIQAVVECFEILVSDLRQCLETGLTLNHSELGPGEVLHRVTTDSGPALVCQFSDRTRTLLLTAPGFDTAQAEAAFEHAPDAVKPKPESPLDCFGDYKAKKPIRVRRLDDLGVELGAEKERA